VRQISTTELPSRLLTTRDPPTALLPSRTTIYLNSSLHLLGNVELARLSSEACACCPIRQKLLYSNTQADYKDKTFDLFPVPDQFLRPPPMYATWVTSLFLHINLEVAEILTVKTGVKEPNEMPWFLSYNDTDMQPVQFHPMYQRQLKNCQRWGSFFPQLRNLEIYILIAWPYDRGYTRIRKPRCYKQVLPSIEAELQNWKVSVDVRNVKFTVHCKGCRAWVARYTWPAKYYPLDIKPSFCSCEERITKAFEAMKKKKA
jgi:hypothetical protein